VLVAVALRIVLLRETLTWPVAIGGALIVAGSVVMMAF
jgi:uncharacterized membrane protein